MNFDPDCAARAHTPGPGISRSGNPCPARRGYYDHVISAGPGPSLPMGQYSSKPAPDQVGRVRLK